MKENKSTGLKTKELERNCEKTAALIPAGEVDQWEIFAAREVENDIEVFNGNIESLSFSDSTGIGIRVFRDHSVGYACTSVMEEGAVRDAVEKAIANSEVTGRDLLKYLPTARDFRISGRLLKNRDLFDGGFLDVSIKDKIKMAVELESATKKVDKRITAVADLNYGDALSEVCILNSNGFSGSYSSTISMMYLSAISREGSDVSTGDYFGISRNPSGINIVEIAEKAAERSLAILGGKKIKSGRMNIVMDPMVSARFMGVIASALDADSVQKGKSLFGGKKGERLFEIDIDIFDDGTLPDGLASKPFDGEGVAKGKTTVFKKGVLKTYLYDTYTARKDNAISTGNAVRASYRSTPAVGASNFYIVPGRDDPGDLIKNAGRGLYIMDIIGLGSGTNPISGHMSVGVKGLMIENGELTRPVREVTIATDILSFLSSFRMLGNDLKFIPSGGYMGSPSVLVENIAISGK
jgi:PmbA protein